MPGRSRLTRAAILVALVPALASCAPHVDDIDAAEAAPVTIDEVELAVDVYRTRFDPERGTMQIAVHNAGATPLRVVSASLDSPALERPLWRDGETTIPAGATRDLPVLLAGARCPAPTTTAPDARLDILLADGSTAVVELSTVDRLGQWVAWFGTTCDAAAVEAVVQLELRRAPERDVLDAGSSSVIGLDLVAVGTGAPGAVAAIESIGGTVLLSVVDTDGQRGSSIPIDTRVSPGARVTVPLTVAPARCDPHAIAEDKQGTRFPVTVRVGGDTDRAITVVVATDDQVRAGLYDAIRQVCGLPD
ncbi:MAG: hypothetical protein RJQ01_05690 [Microcella sp.]|uniref:hypothetical protein n=1 Tax=Microcella sp. TaxID=1913979 RepID=UPI0033160814